MMRAPINSLTGGMVYRAAALIPLVIVILSLSSRPAEAQYVSRWMNNGSLHVNWSELGLYSEQNFPRKSSPLWEGIAKESGHAYGNVDEIGVANIRSFGGGPGPVVQGVSFRGRNIQRYWPKRPFKMVSKRPSTEVTVDGLPSFNRPTNIDEVDPSIKADRMIVANYGTWMGIERETRVHYFESEPHDDYYIVEMTMTNTGNTDQDEDIEEERTLEGVYFARRYTAAGYPRYAGEATWRGYRWGSGIDGARTLETVDDHPEYDVDFTSFYYWLGPTERFTEWNAIGGPVMRKTNWVISSWDTIGRLASGGMGFEADVYAPSRSMSAEETPWDVDDAGDSQPNGTHYQGNEGPEGNAPFWGYDAFEATHLPDGWWNDQLECPPEAFPDAETWEQRISQCETNSVSNANRTKMTYGPYDLEHGEKLTFVQAVGVAGLSRKAKFEIGRKNKRRWEQGLSLYETMIEFDANGDGVITDTEVDGAEGDEVMNKNMWVMSARDSVFQAIERAKAVYQAGLEVTEVPVRPKNFSVASQPDRIRLQWTLFEDAPEPDSFAVYRTTTSFRTLHRQVATVPASPGQKSYTYDDQSVERGVGYYYYVQGINHTESSPAGAIPVGTKIKSNRYATQTFTPAQLLRGPGESLSDARVVPNPLNVGASTDIRYRDQENKIGFLEIPGQSTIRIYTELGEHVRTLEHTDGSGDEYWNLTTESNQVAQTGIYLAIIEDHETGNQITRRFVIIR
jgi:hypothetical protein